MAVAIEPTAEALRRIRAAIGHPARAKYLTARVD
jgi:hypothetical protein